MHAQLYHLPSLLSLSKFQMSPPSSNHFCKKLFEPLCFQFNSPSPTKQSRSHPYDKPKRELSSLSLSTRPNLFSTTQFWNLLLLIHPMKFLLQTTFDSRRLNVPLLKSTPGRPTTLQFDETLSIPEQRTWIVNSLLISLRKTLEWLPKIPHAYLSVLLSLKPAPLLTAFDSLSHTATNTLLPIVSRLHRSAPMSISPAHLWLHLRRRDSVKNEREGNNWMKEKRKGNESVKREKIHKWKGEEI